MTTYYKATRPDGTSFRDPNVRYQAGETVTHPTSHRFGDLIPGDPGTYLSVATVPTDCTGMGWPCRLFEVEGVGRPVRAERLPNKRGFRAVKVVRELPAHDVFGPNGQHVVALIDRAGHLTADETSRLAAAGAATWDAARAAAWDAARAAAWPAAWDAAWDGARDGARDGAWDGAWDGARDAARAAARGAARALVCRDLIGDTFTQAHYDLLTGPWAQVIGPAHPHDKPRT